MSHESRICAHVTLRQVQGDVCDGDTVDLPESKSTVTVVPSANVVRCLRWDSSRNSWLVISSSPTRLCSAHAARIRLSSALSGPIERYGIPALSRQC